MIGAALGFVLGIAAYTTAMFYGIMPAGYEITSAGITVAIIGYGLDWIIRRVLSACRAEPP